MVVILEGLHEGNRVGATEASTGAPLDSLGTVEEVVVGGSLGVLVGSSE